MKIRDGTAQEVIIKAHHEFIHYSRAKRRNYLIVYDIY